MIEFSYGSDDCEGLVIVTANIGRWAAGSVAVRELGSRQVSVGRLHVGPEWRCQHVARRLMSHVLEMYPRTEKWLYAEPYRLSADEPAGPPAEVLERFYESLGFAVAEDALGRRAMVFRLTDQSAEGRGTGQAG